MRTLHITFEQHDPMGMPTILQREIWDSSLETLTRYLPKAKDFFAYLRNQTATRFKDRGFRVDDQSMVFEFEGEFAGFARHAVTLMVAARQETLAKLAEHHDIKLIGLVSLSEALKNVEGTYDGSFDPTDSESCTCPVCKQLRPDDAVESQWIAALESNANAAEEASFLILNSAEPSIDSLRALAGASIELGEYRLRRALYQLGRRLPGDRFTALRQAVETSRAAHEAAGLIAVLAGLDVESGVRFEALRAQFDAESPTAETAIEFLGYGEVPASERDELAEALAECVGRNDDIDYAIALTLYNVFREVDYPPSIVKTALADLSGARGEAADVAGRALAWFESRR